MTVFRLANSLLVMEMSLAASVAGEVRAEMARARISGVALAGHLGKSHAYVSRRLTGVVPFNVAELQKIAEILGVPVEQLLPTSTQAGAA